MKNLWHWILSTFVCGLDSHVPENYITETTETIYVKRCKRCKHTLGLGYWKGVIDIPPPNRTKEQWEDFCLKTEEELRNACKKYEKSYRFFRY